MTARTYDPARVFVRGGGLTEGIEWGAFLAMTVWWVVELGLGPFQLVLLGIVLETSVLLGETPTGVVADLKSRKRSVVISHVLTGLSFIWLFATTDYWLALPAQALFGIGWTFRSGADTAWVTDELKGENSDLDDDFIDRLLLRRHRVGIAWAMVAVVVTVLIGISTSVRWAGISMGVLQLGVGVYFAIAMREDHFVPASETGRRFMDTLREGLRVVAGRPRLRVLVGVVLMLDMGAEAFDRLGFKHFLDNSKFEDDSLLVLGALFLALTLAGLAVNVYATRALDRRVGVARLAVALLGFAAVGGLLVSLTNMVLVIAIGYMLQDSVREALWPVLEGWTNRDAPSEVRATVHSLIGQVTATGELIGGLLLGALAEIVSIQVSLLVGALFFGVSGLLATRAIAPRNETVDLG